VPYAAVDGWDDDAGAPIISIAAAASTVVVATPAGVWDVATRTLFPLPTVKVDAIDNQYWALDGTGTVRCWDEGASPLTPGCMRQTGQSQALSAFLAGTDRAAATIGANGTTLVNTTTLSGGNSRGDDAFPCDLADLDAEAINARSEHVVVGRNGVCMGSGDVLPGYTAVRIPPGSSNTGLSLLHDPNPTQVRVGSNGDQATVLMETDVKIMGARIVGTTTSPTVDVLAIAPSARGVLDDVEQLADPDRYVFTLTNRGSTPLALQGQFVLPPQVSAVVFARWPSGVEKIYRLDTRRPHAPLVLSLNTARNTVYLASSCLGSQTGGPTTFCPSAAPHHFVLQLTAP
jgi:hypothetical protein